MCMAIRVAQCPPQVINRTKKSEQKKIFVEYWGTLCSIDRLCFFYSCSWIAVIHCDCDLVRQIFFTTMIKIIIGIRCFLFALLIVLLKVSEVFEY